MSNSGCDFVFIRKIFCKLLIFFSSFNQCFSFHQESEITDMRQTIELLKKQSIQAGLTSAHMQSMGQQVNGKGGSEGSPSKKSLNGSHDTGLHNGNGNGNGMMQRHHSTDSVCSTNSLSSNCSAQDKKKKKGWVSHKTYF